MCWSVCPEGNTNTGRLTLQALCPDVRCGRLAAAVSGFGPPRLGATGRMGPGAHSLGRGPWRRGSSVGGPKVGGIGVEGDVCSRGAPRATVRAGTWKHLLMASGQSAQGKEDPSKRAAAPRPTRGSSGLSRGAPARPPAGWRPELAGALKLLKIVHPPATPPLDPPSSPRKLFSGSSV